MLDGLLMLEGLSTYAFELGDLATRATCCETGWEPAGGLNDSRDPSPCSSKHVQSLKSSFNRCMSIVACRSLHVNQESIMAVQSLHVNQASIFTQKEISIHDATLSRKSTLPESLRK